ncbi:hypothetical protein SAMN05216486_11125 [bacterium JGI 053]|nr:hypothetical protein SAMN05216486_11125 [bacterium JGI 053]
MNIAALRSRIEDVERRVDDLRHSTEHEPLLSSRLALASMDRHSRDLRRQLRQSMVERRVEVVSLRFIGKRAAYGRLPLTILSRVATALSDSVAAAAERVRRGRVVQRITNGMREAVNLQLADVLQGSTELLVIGDTAPDLFGNSSLADALEETFALLAATDDQSLADRVSLVGVRAAKKIGELLAVAASNGLELDVQWLNPNDKVLRWTGSLERMTQVRRALEGFTNVDTEELFITGRAVSLSLRGRFEIESNGRLYSGTFPAEVQQQVTNIRLGETVAAQIERSEIVNNLMESRKQSYSLLSVHSVGQTELAPNPITD